MLALVLDWLMAPIDPMRAHVITDGVSWHGRLMVLAWGMLIPLGVVIARYFKVTARQNWPSELDNKFWWRGHLFCQYSGGVAMLCGFAAIWFATGNTAAASLHRNMGYAVLGFGAVQFVAGWLRGSKGGPTEQNIRGDHYDMTPRRVVFEHLHKSVGYLAILVAAVTILTGLWIANAPRWMWFGLAAWWTLLAMAAARLQSLGRHVSSYHAIWGPDPAHPGNRKA